MTDDYAAFLRSKEVRAEAHGFDVDESAISAALFPFQRRIVRWALRKGRAAVFAGTGLGKTGMQLEWARHVVERQDRIWRDVDPNEDPNKAVGEFIHEGRVLVLAPLAVAPQTVREGAKFGIDVRQVREQADVGGAGIYVTNYEMLDKFDPAAFVGVVLDESSILKNYSGKTKQALLAAFEATPYRLACTATPAPNDHLELGNHAQFLGVMASNEMIARWFVNDPMEAGKYRLKGHAADDFWRWVHSWAVSCERPSDLGFPDDGYVLPPLRMIERVVAADATKDVPDGHLFRTGSLSATSLHKEARLTTDDRAKEVAAIVGAEAGERWLVLCNTDYEADALMAVLPGAVEVRGSMSREMKEERLDAFQRGDVQVLVSKPRIAGFGLNFQICARIVFVGLSYSYEQLYQAIRRCWRFGQTRPVDAYIVRADTEGQVLAAVQEKSAKHEEMKHAMNDAMRREQLREKREDYGLVRTPPVLFAEGQRWKLWRGDNVDVLRAMEPNSIHLSVTSPPFSNLYIYSDAAEDMGNSDDDAQFMEHYTFTIRELHRVTLPGRLAVVHCKDLPLYKGRDGSAGLRDFPGAIIRAFESCGWTFHSRVTVWKCPVTEMQRTKNHGLLYKNLRGDSTVSRMGMADYVLAFRKWDGIADNGTSGPEPVTHERDDFPLEQWQAWASPVWMDVNQMRVLDYRDAKEQSDERHICLARGSLVLTRSRGFVPIESVSAGDETLTHRGRWRKVLKTEMTGVRECVTVRAQGVPGLTLTPDHWLWVRRGSTRKSARKSSPGWLPAEEIARGAYLNTQVPEPTLSATHGDSFWWIVGRWIADGHWGARNGESAYVSIGRDKIDAFLGVAYAYAGSAGDHGSCVQYRLRDRDGELRDVLRRCGSGCENKQLPPETWDLPAESAKALLLGYLSGDGHHLASRNRWSASSVSKRLVLGIALLAQRVFGAVASAYPGAPPGTCVIEGRKMNTMQSWVVSFDVPDHARYNGLPFVDGGGAWRKAKSVSHAGERETWNLRVEEDESFTAEGCVVKNCPLQLDVIERAIVLYSNRGDLVLDPFNGIGSTGHEALRLGRRYVGAELKESYCRMAAKVLDAAEKDATAPTLFSGVGGRVA